MAILSHNQALAYKATLEGFSPLVKGLLGLLSMYGAINAIGQFTS